MSTCGGAVQVAAFAGATYGVELRHMLELIGVYKSSAGNLLDLLKLLKGSKPVETVTLDNGSVQVTIEGDNNQVLVFPGAVLALAGDRGVRRAAYAVAKPVQKRGIDLLEFREGRKVQQRITPPEAGHLEEAARRSDTAPLEKAPDAPQIVEEVVTVDLVQAVFNEAESFRFFDGETKFFARITDSRWWDGIHDRTKGYFEGDRLKVRMRITQTTDLTGRLHREREIVEVLTHHHAPRQRDLFDGGEVA